ncbi:MAG: ribonuclease III [Bacteroidaceae bacterium]|nr:ribonuclease III [Bacteroidaceae bacterium]
MKINRVFKKLIDRIRLLSCKDRESYLLLYSILGYIPNNLRLYKMAMTHSSSSGNGRKQSCNERLEFLGDAVLGSIVSDYLYTNFRKEREGFLSKSRSNLVCRERLNELALEIGLDRFVTACGLPKVHNSYVYGNALEALIGAIYIDKGYKQCRRFLLDRVLSRLTDIECVVKSDKNYKSRLIEWSQKQHKTVEFKLVSEEMRKEGVFFVSEVFVDSELYGSGDGFSKRESQQKAARVALEKLEF